MLEPLVSSRIRRTLIEYLLAHPAERVYLRGLAKQLDLSISPLRRELKRLETAGMLKATDEGSMRFYLVDPASPLFVQLRQAAAQPSGAVPALSASLSAPSGVSAGAPVILSSASVERTRQAMRRVTRWPWLLGTIGLSLGLVVAVGSALYVMSTNRQILSLLKPSAVEPPAVAAVTRPRASASGAMHSSRWHLSPGPMGGFSSGSQSERY